VGTTVHETTEAQPAAPRPALRRPIAEIRAEFPDLADGEVRLDGAAGTLAPRPVIDAVSEALRVSMANLHGEFAASRRSGQTVAAARQALADLVGGVAEGVVLGPNMTTLTFHFADAISADWQPSDEVIVTSLDHDANIRPWVLAAQRRGATVRWAEFDPETGELPVEAFEGVIGERTRVVAFTAASNAIGTRPDVRAIADRVHAAGALTYVDGVHATPHGPIDITALGADFYACSTYKLFGPHVGAVIANPGQLERLEPPKLVPSPDTVPERFERGTPALELLAGVTAATDWIADLTEAQGGRREGLLAALKAVDARLSPLFERAVSGLVAIPGVRVLGAAKRRTPTVSFVIEGHHSQQIVGRLAANGIAVWSGDNYAYELMGRLGLRQRGGAVRASLVLYNDEHDVDRLLEGVAEIVRG
jgi:cysteine desulfurase family protein (TIGR01976 family)